MSQGGGLDGQLGIELMVERAAAGEAPSSPQPPEAGARRARLYGVSSGAENRNRQTMPSNWCGTGLLGGDGPRSADLEHVADLPLTAWSGLTASFCAFDLPLADMREDGAEVLVLDDGSLRNLPQFVEGGVGQVEPAVADRQPAVGIIDDGCDRAAPRRRADRRHRPSRGDAVADRFRADCI